MRFKKVIIGGTFDLLHAGHQELINHAFDLGEEVDIGVTSDEFNKQRGKETYETQESRLKNLEEFLKQNNYFERTKIILINNIFGTSLEDPSIQALIATEETLPNAEIVNQEREKKGFKRLEIINLSHAKDKSGKIISSSRIRNGEINSEGEIYLDLLLKIADQKLNEEVLNKFKAPLGEIVSLGDVSGEIITVGDVTTEEISKRGIVPKLSIVDLKIQRSPVTLSEAKGIYSSVAALPQNDKVSNPNSTISRQLILEIDKAIKSDGNGHVIVVEGEEDLATIPAVLLSPFGMKVLYGQPNVGVVQVIVDREIKDRVCEYLGF